MKKRNTAITFVNRRQKKPKTRRLSLWRLSLSLVIVAAAASTVVMKVQSLQETSPAASSKPWFASYVDVTSTPQFDFDNMGTTANKDAVLSFVVSSSNDACTPSWGDAYSLDQASDSLDLDRRIARLQQQGGSVAISFGGQLNNELALGCTDQTKLEAAYSTVIDRYKVNTIDLDLEGSDLTNSAAMTRRAEAISALQQSYRAAHKPLAIWLTLPATPDGLSVSGTDAVSQFLSKKVDLAGVNVMTMDYGNSLPDGESMAIGSENALQQTERQLSILYKQAGFNLSSKALWSKIGATPMIGQNDTSNEIFSLNDAETLNNFAVTQGVGRMSMWSANRDITCGSNYIDTSVVSDSCSGVVQGNKTFASILSNQFNGDLELSAGKVTKSDSKVSTVQADNPATSPYQIWSADGAYLEGTKVVWHHNVYQAKWWTEGDVPDNPVLQAYQTPWQLIGPVLAGEKPIQQVTLPAGTYPDWSGSDVYNTGDRVLFNGVPYQAKWWNQGDSPAAASSNSDSSPWTPLTQTQINAVIAGTSK